MDQGIKTRAPRAVPPKVPLNMLLNMALILPQGSLIRGSKVQPLEMRSL